MKTMRKFLSMAALALVGAMMTGCSGSDDSIADTPQQPANTSKTVTLTTTVGLDGGTGTRALTGGGVKTFAAGETMAVVYNNGSSTVKAVSHPLEAGDIADGAKSATFTFDLKTPNTSVPVTYIYPAAMAGDTDVDYSKLYSQDGTLATLSSTLDLATKTEAWEGTSLPAATLENQLAILAVTLKDDAATPAEITSGITRLVLSDGANSYTVSRSAAAGPIYVAIRPTDAAAITVTATDVSQTYLKSLTGKTYAAGNGYNVSWKMAIGKTMPLTMEAITDGTIRVITPKTNMQYTKNGGTKTAMSSDISVNTGDKVQFYGNGTEITSYYGTNIAGGTATVKVYGNIMSLVDEGGFATATTLTSNQAFATLFVNSESAVNDKLTDASGLLLPATTLTDYCYNGMFQGCTNLTAAPALPAETLINGCYMSMFQGCTRLTAAPVLPAKKLVENCYYGMFNGCSNLSAVTCLATDKSASSCTYNWLSGVAATGTFTKASAMTSWSTGADGIPDGWDVEDAQ